MKLLLTSSGLTNNSIIQALKDLVDKPFSELSIAFIPTAANTFSEDKGWLLTEMQEIYDLNFKKFDIVDIAVLSEEEIKKRLNLIDIVVLGGGDTYPLLQEIQKKHVEDALHENKIYVGISAGSMITAPQMTYALDAELYDEGEYEQEIDKGLGYVSFHIKPHFLSHHFSKVTESNVEKIQRVVQQTIYLLDDQSAIKVDGDHIEVISEGNWKKIR